MENWARKTLIKLVEVSSAKHLQNQSQKCLKSDHQRKLIKTTKMVQGIQIVRQLYSSWMQVLTNSSTIKSMMSVTREVKRMWIKSCLISRHSSPNQWKMLWTENSLATCFSQTLTALLFNLQKCQRRQKVRLWTLKTSKSTVDPNIFACITHKTVVSSTI